MLLKGPIYLHFLSVLGKSCGTRVVDEGQEALGPRAMRQEPRNRQHYENDPQLHEKV